MTMSLSSKALPDGKIVITMVDEAEKVHGVVIKAADASVVAADILASAIQSARLSKKSAPQRDKKKYNGIRPSQLSLSEDENGLTLVLYFGEALLGVALKKGMADKLGKMLLAAGATKDKAQ